MKNWKLSVFLIVSFIYPNAAASNYNYGKKSARSLVHTRINEYRNHLKGIEKMMKKHQQKPHKSATVDVHKVLKQLNGRTTAHGGKQDHRQNHFHRESSLENTENRAILGPVEFSTHGSKNVPPPANISSREVQSRGTTIYN